jgi:hypothetical protein
MLRGKKMLYIAAIATGAAIGGIVGYLGKCGGGT